MPYFRVTIDGKTGEPVGDVATVDRGSTVGVGDREVFCHHLVSAKDQDAAKKAAKKEHADETKPCPRYPVDKQVE